MVCEEDKIDPATGDCEIEGVLQLSEADAKLV